MRCEINPTPPTLIFFFHEPDPIQICSNVLVRPWRRFLALGHSQPHSSILSSFPTLSRASQPDSSILSSFQTLPRASQLDSSILSSFPTLSEASQPNSSMLSSLPTLPSMLSSLPTLPGAPQSFQTLPTLELPRYCRRLRHSDST